MTHLTYIFAAYGLAFISMGMMTLRTICFHRQTKKKLQQLMNEPHES